MKQRPLEIVVATDVDGGIAKDGKIPWSLPPDMKRFKELTTTTKGADHIYWNTVIMGRKTWDSLPGKNKPLPGRFNIVLTRDRNMKNADGMFRVAYSLSMALRIISHEPDLERTFIIGGGEVYTEALNHPLCTTIHRTRILKPFGCDTFFRPQHGGWKLMARSVHEHGEPPLSFYFETWHRRMKFAEEEKA